MFGGEMHLASVDETTFAGLFPRGPNTQKVSLALLTSRVKSNGRKLLPRRVIVAPPLNGAKSGTSFYTLGSL